MSEESTCSVCIETFTKQPHRKQACCPYCDVKACVTCTQTYLLSTHEDAHCMGCRRGWTREVLDGILLTTWLNGAYKVHRQNILLDRERSRLPAAQIFLENVKKGQALLPELQIIQENIRQLELQMQQQRTEWYRINRLIGFYNNGIEPTNIASVEAQEKEKRVFIMPCPASACRGFLSSAYKCGLCDIYCCPDCHEIKGASRDEPHTCDETTVATVRAIKKECRNCPDCGTNIFRTEGCSLMFCTNCNTPFDWVSGKKVTHGAIHNPHYFEYLRATNGGVMPRNPGDIPCAGNIPNAWTFDREVFRRYGHPTAGDWLYSSLQVVTHIQHVEIPNTTNNAEDTDNMQYNIRYLSKDITEVRWKQVLAQREKRRIKRDEIRQRYEAFVGACADIYGRVMATAREGVAPERDGGVLTRGQPIAPTINKEKREAVAKVCTEAKEQLLVLRKIFNDGLMDISKRYKCQVMQLNETGLKREMKKYESGRAPRRVKRSDGETVASSASGDAQILYDDDDDTDSVVQEFIQHQAQQNQLVRQGQ